MFKNYLITFWKVLQRHKFFTFVSLFGISITLMVLIVLSAIFDSTLGSYGPEKENDRILYVFGGTFKLKVDDNSSQTSMRGSASWHYFDETVRKLKLPEHVTVMSLPQPVVCYTSGGKIDVMRKFTDGEFWKVFTFRFIYGKPYSIQDVDLAKRVVVVDRKTAENYFGDASCVGKQISIGGYSYTVCGVVEETSITRFFPFSNIYVPFTTAGDDFRKKVIYGIYVAAIKAKKPSDRKAIQEEYQSLVRKFQFPDPNEFNSVTSYADSYMEIFTRNFIGRAGENSYMGLFIFLVCVLILLFMSFPAMNLVNINITRIMERASEIGIRRSFGASIKTLLTQFLIENILITLIGGIIGFFLALVMIFLINRSGIFPHFFLNVNFPLFIYAVLLSILFGILSGVVPAFRMARTNIVNALKS
jgi:putative ABC transport system permease protein